MCGRYLLISPVVDIAEAFGVNLKANLPARYNVAPGQPILGVRLGENGKREPFIAEWGLIPSWAKDRAKAKPQINARSETVHEKPTFRGAYRHRRCLLPANGFYEWKDSGQGKQPWLITKGDKELIGLAGLWELWTGPDGGSYLETVSVITEEAGPVLRDIHNRKPLMLQPNSHDIWLKAENPLKEVLAIDEKELRCQPVSRRLNRVSNDDETVLSADPVPEQATLL